MSDFGQYLARPASRHGEDRDTLSASPRIPVCRLDAANQCLGCDRSLEQISCRTLMSKAEQWSVIDELAARAAVNTGTIAAGDGGS